MATPYDVKTAEQHQRNSDQQMNRLNRDDLTAGATEGGGKQTKLLAALLVWQASISSGCFPKLCPISFSKSLSGGGSWKAGRQASYSRSPVCLESRTTGD